MITDSDGESSAEKCDVCLQEDSSKTNMMVYCDGKDCNLPIHQSTIFFKVNLVECYGIKQIPKGDWFCDRCVFISQTSKSEVNDFPLINVICCKEEGGSLKKCPQNTGAQTFVHLSCVLWSNAVTLSKDLEISNLIPAFFGKKECVICNSSFGLTNKCNDQNCNHFMHTRCAVDSNLIQNLPPKKIDKTLFLCKSHSNLDQSSSSNCEEETKNNKKQETKKRKRKLTESSSGSISDNPDPGTTNTTKNGAKNPKSIPPLLKNSINSAVIEALFTDTSETEISPSKNKTVEYVDDRGGETVYRNKKKSSPGGNGVTALVTKRQSFSKTFPSLNGDGFKNGFRVDEKSPETFDGNINQAFRKYIFEQETKLKELKSLLDGGKKLTKIPSNNNNNSSCSTPSIPKPPPIKNTGLNDLLDSSFAQLEKSQLINNNNNNIININKPPNNFEERPFLSKIQNLETENQKLKSDLTEAKAASGKTLKNFKEKMVKMFELLRLPGMNGETEAPSVDNFDQYLEFLFCNVQEYFSSTDAAEVEKDFSLLKK